MNATTPLTPAQRKFLAGYLPDILQGAATNLANADRAEFVRCVTGMDFDDGEESSAWALRIARNLKKAGLLAELDIHRDVAGGRHIYLSFSTTGAQALFEISVMGT